MNTINTQESIVNRIDEMTTLFYQERFEQGIGILNEILPDLTDLIGNITVSEMQDALLMALKFALQAIEQQEWTLLADVFHFEICNNLRGI